MVRKALHERDGDHEYIVTISGRGYRFVARVSRFTRAQFAERRSAPAGGQTVSQAATEPPSEHREESGSLGHTRLPGRNGWQTTWPPAGTTLLLTALLASAGVLLLASWTGLEDQGAQRRLWQLTSTGRLDGEPTWSPDGQYIAYSSDRDGNFRIWTQRVSGGTPVRITSGPGRDWQPSWSADGRHIAFRSERDGGGLFVVPLAGGGARRLTSFGHQPQWSPDGSQILFCEGRDLYVVSAEGGGPPAAVPGAILSSRSDRCRVAWHPDGRRVSGYAFEQGRGWVFWTMPATGGPRVVSKVSPPVEQRLREADVRLGGFAWAPGGDALYFEGRSERTQNLWRVRINPRTQEWISGPDRLTTSAGLESGLTLSPDGKRLAFGSRFERTSVWSFPFNAIAGEITGEGHAITPDGANAKILDISPDGTQLVYRINSRDTDELWIRSLDEQSDRLRKVEINAEIVHPRWSRTEPSSHTSENRQTALSHQRWSSLRPTTSGSRRSYPPCALPKPGALPRWFTTGDPMLDPSWSAAPRRRPDRRSVDCPPPRPRVARQRCSCSPPTPTGTSMRRRTHRMGDG
jgi:Tol biopolymer transport system component